ncbi:MAG: MFS transporter [Haloferacaceae archaeon]
MTSWVRRALTVEYPRQVWLVTAAHGVNEFYSVALPPILPLLVSDFGLTYGQAGALVTVFFAMYSVFQLPAGMLADRIGQQRLLSGGMVLLGAGLFVVANAGSYPVMLAGQALAGVGGSTYHPSGMSLISDLEAGETEGRAMGIHGLGGVAGMALAPVLVGGVASLGGWRLALTVAALVGVAYAGCFTLLFSMPASFETREVADGGAEANPEATAAGRGLRERVRAAVAVPLAWWVVGLFAVNFLISFEIGSVRTFAPTYLFERLANSSSVANAIYFVMLVGAGAASIGAGNLADRFDRRRAGAAALAVSALALGATALVPARPELMLGWFLLLGVVLYAASPMKNALTAAYSERESSGSLFGVMLSASSLGGATGPFLLGLVAERIGWATAFPAIGLVSLVGAGVFLSLTRL